VDLDEAEVGGRVAPQRGDGLERARQAGVRIASRMVMPSASFCSSQAASKCAGERAGARKVAL
jgi:hypothetical protein